MRLTTGLTVFILFTFLVLSCKKKEQPSPAIPQQEAFRVSDAVIYELYVRDFSREGTFNGVLRRLDSLKMLGVNVIWFIPVNPYGKLKSLGPYGSPYCIMNYYQVNSEYGTMADFDNLVGAVHAKGMKVMVDWVANHTSWDNPWITAHPNWYKHNTSGEIIPPIPEWADVAGLDYSNNEMRDSMIQVMKWWVVKHNIDGYRCDAADMIPDDFWKRCLDTLTGLSRPLLMLAEGSRNSHYASGFQLTYSWNYFTALKKVFNGMDAGYLAAMYNTELRSLPDGNYKLLFTTNHDETYKATPLQLYGGKAGAEAASVITACLAPVPLIYNGQEVGDSLNINMSYKWPINWNMNRPMFSFYSKLFTLYRNNAALRYGKPVFYNVSNQAVIFEKSYMGKSAVVIVNVRNQPVSFTMPSALAGITRHDELSGEVVSDTVIHLDAYRGMILVP